MKFTSVAIVALFLANTSAVKLQDDCDGKWCNKGLAYDLDEGTLRKAEADNVAKNQHFNGATVAAGNAASTYAGATAAANAAAAADAAAGQAKAAAAATFAGSDYKNRDQFKADEAANGAAVHAKEAALDASLKAADDERAKQLISARKDRDLAASTAAKAAPMPT